MAVERFSEVQGSNSQLIPCELIWQIFQVIVEGLAAVRGERQDDGAAVPVNLRLSALILFQHDVKITAAESERADACAARMRMVRHPRPRLRIHVKRACIQEHFERVVNLDRWGQNFVVQRECRFDQPGRAGRGLGMADLRFDRAERAPTLRSVNATVFLKNLGQACDFGGITHGRAGTVALDEFNRFGGDIGNPVGVPERFALPVCARSVDGVAAAVTGRADAFDDSIDTIVVTFGVFEPLEDDDAKSFTKDSAVSLLVERPGISRS